jgi:hypothetical protein
MRFLVAAFCLLSFHPVLAQTNGDPSASRSQKAPLVFLDCDVCDVSYIRRQIPFVNWVRDREDAVVHVLITRSRTAAGGNEYLLDFIGLKAREGTGQSLLYVSPPSYTNDEVREGITGILKIGLLPFLDPPVLSQMRVDFAGAQDMDLPVAPELDRWDRWVFEIEASGHLEKETQRTEVSLDGGVSADRVTEQWRIRNYLDLDYDEDRFGSSGVSSRSSSESWSHRSVVTRSLGPHLSAGVSMRFWSATYDNVDLGMQFSPAIEYSYWPYDMDQKASLTVAYYVGQRRLDYAQRTVYGERKETRFNQTLDVDLRLNQPWGSVRASLEGSHYFHDVQQYRIELYNRLSVRLFRGLSLRLEGGVDRINDQLSLAAGEASLEEILLRRRELATDYEVWGQLGFSYIFGSIYNNVVNNRL